MTHSPFARHGLALAIAGLASLPAFALASPAASSPYQTDPQSTHVEDATSQGIAQVNMITCFTTNMRPDAMVNKGAYKALVTRTSATRTPAPTRAARARTAPRPTRRRTWRPS